MLLLVGHSRLLTPFLVISLPRGRLLQRVRPAVMRGGLRSMRMASSLLLPRRVLRSRISIGVRRVRVCLTIHVRMRRRAAASHHLLLMRRVHRSRILLRQLWCTASTLLFICVLLLGRALPLRVVLASCWPTIWLLLLGVVIRRWRVIGRGRGSRGILSRRSVVGYSCSRGGRRADWLGPTSRSHGGGRGVWVMSVSVVLRLMVSLTMLALGRDNVQGHLLPRLTSSVLLPLGLLLPRGHLDLVHLSQFGLPLDVIPLFLLGGLLPHPRQYLGRFCVGNPGVSHLYLGAVRVREGKE
mmetsp:Transcript_53235/g.159373  ORF Transcript_53235/g.159373 Transcript_53235/m.159373 type:complete len:297 (-) Transcript_53235:716-1606(-)